MEFALIPFLLNLSFQFGLAAAVAAFTGGLDAFWNAKKYHII